MLKKSISLTTAALALGVFGIIGNGCSSSSSSVTSDGGGGGGEGGKDAKAPIDGSGGDSGPACYDTSGAFTYLFGAPVAHQNVCNATQIGDFLTACFSPGTAATCDAWHNANPNCSLCIDGFGPAPDSGVVFDAGPNFDGGAANIPYPATVQVDQTTGLTSANLDGCIAALSTGDDTCKKDDCNLSVCIQSSCSTCDQADTAAQTACLNAAQGDTSANGCPSLITLDSTCQSALTASQTANGTACGASATTFQDQYTAVATTLCGP